MSAENRLIYLTHICLASTQPDVDSVTVADMIENLTPPHCEQEQSRIKAYYGAPISSKPEFQYPRMAIGKPRTPAEEEIQEASETTIFCAFDFDPDVVKYPSGVGLQEGIRSAVPDTTKVQYRTWAVDVSFNWRHKKAPVSCFHTATDFHIFYLPAKTIPGGKDAQDLFREELEKRVFNTGPVIVCVPQEWNGPTVRLNRNGDAMVAFRFDGWSRNAMALNANTTTASCDSNGEADTGNEDTICYILAVESETATAREQSRNVGLQRSGKTTRQDASASRSTYSSLYKLTKGRYERYDIEWEQAGKAKQDEKCIIYRPQGVVAITNSPAASHQESDNVRPSSFFQKIQSMWSRS